IASNLDLILEIGEMWVNLDLGRDPNCIILNSINYLLDVINYLDHIPFAKKYRGIVSDFADHLTTTPKGEFENSFLNTSNGISIQEIKQAIYMLWGTILGNCTFINSKRAFKEVASLQFKAEIYDNSI
ncbi:MAG: hypothetical protein AAF804_16005, partial [Bacteroidota bacterium]